MVILLHAWWAIKTGLFARAAKLGPVAYGARHVRAGPPILQWVLDVRETVITKLSSLNIVAQSFHFRH